MIISSVVLFRCALFKSALSNAGTIFTILAALRTMSEPVKYFPQALSVLIQTKVSFDRTNCFSSRMSLKVRRCCKIRLQHGDLGWNSEVPLLTLNGTNIEVNEGQKFVICGPVCAGKSSLLYVILQKEPELHELRVYKLIFKFGNNTYIYKACFYCLFACT